MSRPATVTNTKAIDSTRSAMLTREQIEPLVSSLRAAHAQLQGLLGLAEQKLAALRSADAGALHRLTHDEATTLDALAASDRARRAVIAELAQVLPGGFGPIERITDFARALPEPESSLFLAKTEGLRVVAARLAEKNRLVANVAQHLQTHLRGALADAAAAGRQEVGYGRNGEKERATTDQWMDALG